MKLSISLSSNWDRLIWRCDHYMVKFGPAIWAKHGRVGQASFNQDSHILLISNIVFSKVNSKWHSLPSVVGISSVVWNSSYIHAIFRYTTPRSAYQLIASTMQTVCISWSTSIQRTIWLSLWWKGERQVDSIYRTWTYVSICSHPRQVRKEWKRIGRISGTSECSAQWLSPPWCYIINLIQGMLSLVLTC